jgi:hypothetical protein
LSVIRNALTESGTSLYAERIRWINEFRRRNRRYPSVQEMPNENLFHKNFVQAQRAVETRAANNAQNIYERAVEEIENASWMYDGQWALMGEHASHVRDVNDGVVSRWIQSRWILNNNYNSFGRISFEMMIDLIYHWQKHKQGQQTLREYVDQINQYLTQAITGGNFRIDQRTGQLSIQSNTHVLIVYVKDGKGYVKTFYKKD